MVKRIPWIVVLALSLLAAGTAVAQDDEAARKPNPTSPDEVTTGEIRLTLTADYVKVRVDGNEWDEHEFMDNGKTLVIHTVPRLQEHAITLTPVGSDLAPVDLTVKPEDWKLATITKTEKMWRVEKKVVFPKAGPKPPADPAKKPTDKPAASPK